MVDRVVRDAADMLGRMTRFEVRIDPSGLAFTADADTPLVRAAQHAGIRLPSSCRNGTCRACICRLRDGRIVHRIDWPGLSAEEKAEGWILPCVALACSDLRIEQPGAASLDPLAPPGRGSV